MIELRAISNTTLWTNEVKSVPGTAPWRMLYGLEKVNEYDCGPHSQIDSIVGRLNDVILPPPLLQRM